MRIPSASFLVIAVIAVLLALNVCAVAAPVIGVANISGGLTLQGGNITFAPTFTNTPGGSETNSFAGLTSGTIQSLTGGPPTGILPTPLVGFVNFTTGLATPVVFDLTSIAPGVGSLAGCSSATPGSICTPSASPLTFVQLTSNAVIAVFQVSGNSYTGNSASGFSPTTVVFSTQNPINGTVPGIYASLVNGGTISGVTYSASFTASPTQGSTVPEPSSFVLTGLALLASGLLARSKF